MRIPEKDFQIKIGPYQYEVIWSDDVTRAGGSYAQIHLRPHKIFLAKSARKLQGVKGSLIHEILHAIWRLAGFDDDRDNENKITLNDEQLISRMTPFLLMVIEENPHIFK